MSERDDRKSMVTARAGAGSRAGQRQRKTRGFKMAWFGAVLVRYSRYVEIIILALAFIVSSIAAVRILFMSVDEAEDIYAQHQLHLSTSAIDQLEVWLEERETAYENPPNIPRKVFSSD